MQSGDSGKPCCLRDGSPGLQRAPESTRVQGPTGNAQPAVRVGRDCSLGASEQELWGGGPSSRRPKDLTTTPPPARHLPVSGRGLLRRQPHKQPVERAGGGAASLCR